jgi:hypothetical protein
VTTRDTIDRAGHGECLGGGDVAASDVMNGGDEYCGW